MRIKYTRTTYGMCDKSPSNLNGRDTPVTPSTVQSARGATGAAKLPEEVRAIC